MQNVKYSKRTKRKLISMMMSLMMMLSMISVIGTKEAQAAGMRVMGNRDAASGNNVRAEVLTAGTEEEFVTSLSADPDSFIYIGGLSQITITGDLEGTVIIAAFDESGGLTDITATLSNATPSEATGSDASSAEVTLDFPGNLSTYNDKVYTIRASQDGGASWSEVSCTVTVQKRIVSSGSGSSGSGGGGGSSSVSSSGNIPRWVQNEIGWWYQNSDGTWPASKWMRLDYSGRRDWYYFDAAGYMVDGWLDWNGDKYYLHEISDGTRGHMYTGWHIVDGKWYYFNTGLNGTEGAMLKDTTTPDNYKVGADGVWIP